MIYTGETEFTRFEEICDPDEGCWEREIPLSVSWSCEISEYGDGSKDYEWDFSAWDEADKLVQLTEEEELRLIQELQNEGALA